MTQAQNKCVEVSNVYFAHNGEPVLENISFSVDKGEYLGIIGPNGGGKTTLIKILIGLIRPQAGKVKTYGSIGYVPQRAGETNAQFPATVEEVVQSGRTPFTGFWGKFSPEDRQSVEEALTIAGIKELRNRMISELSGGERQRVFIARAMAGKPDILVLDEPSAGVDIATQEKFYLFLESLNKDRGLTIIFVTHDIDVIAHEAKNLLCLNKKLVCHGPPRELLKDEYLEKVYGKKMKYILHH